MFCKRSKAQTAQLPPVTPPLPMAPAQSYVWSGSFMVGRMSAPTEPSSSCPSFGSHIWGARMHLACCRGTVEREDVICTRRFLLRSLGS